MPTPRHFSAAAFVAIAVLLAAPVTAASATPQATTQQPDARSTARPLASNTDEPARMVEVDPADFSEAGAALPVELQQALARDADLTGAEWLAQSEAGNAAADVVADLAEVIEVVDARLEGYDLVVTVETAADALIAQEVGARVEFGTAAESRVSEPIEGLEQAADLRGGMPYLFPDGASSFRCSVGFVGFDSQTDQLQIMSAGHCEGNTGSMRTAKTVDRPTISGGSITAPDRTIGNAGLHVTDEFANPGFLDGGQPIRTYYDLGMTPVTNNTWVGKPEVVTWGNSTSGAPLASAPLVIRDAGPAIVGSTLCKSGSTTGWTCGPITDVDEIQFVGSGTASCPATGGNYCVGSIQANLCVRGGDSGGAAVVGSRAVGITSAATNSLVPTCTATNNIGVFSTLYSAVPAYEQVTKIFPDWEPLLGFDSELTNVNPRIPFSTTSLPARVIGGATRHTVSVSIDGGTAVSRPVSANGAWDVPIGSLTGTHTWSAIAKWETQTQATPSTGEFLRADASRIFGDDRYLTPVQISLDEFPGTSTPNGPVTPGVPVVYLANGASFPDALSAGPAAALEGGPLLLTPAGSLPPAVAAELDRLNPQRIVIVGGSAVVSNAVQSQASAYAVNGTVRIGGESRYETSRLIAQRMLANGLSTGDDLWVATGTDFPDALSAGAAAAAQGVPILLVFGVAGSLDAPTSTFINSTLQSSRVFIAGGTGVVSPGIQSSLTSLASTTSVVRRGGDDRFATSRLVNELAYPGTAPEVFFSYGFNFPDALAGSVVAGLRGGPLYITATACVQPAIVDDIFDLSPSQVTVFGGTAIVSDNARDLRRC